MHVETIFAACCWIYLQYTCHRIYHDHLTIIGWIINRFLATRSFDRLGRTSCDSQTPPLSMGPTYNTCNIYEIHILKIGSRREPENDIKDDQGVPPIVRNHYIPLFGYHYIVIPPPRHSLGDPMAMVRDNYYRELCPGTQPFGTVERPGARWRVPVYPYCTNYLYPFGIGPQLVLTVGCFDHDPLDYYSTNNY